jgi:hypothetical protein
MCRVLADERPIEFDAMQASSELFSIWIYTFGDIPSVNLKFRESSPKNSPLPVMTRVSAAI